MATIVTLSDLDKWVPIDADQEPLAQVNLDAASLVVTDTAGHPEWTTTTAPARARLIAVQLAKRAFLNPNAIVRSAVGPLSEAQVEDYARTLEPTEAEREYLLSLRPDAGSGGGSLFTLSLAGSAAYVPDTIYVTDLSGGLVPWYAVGEIGSP